MKERAESNNDFELELEIKRAEENHKNPEPVDQLAMGTLAAGTLQKGDKVVKVPVVLAELTLQIDMDTNITLPEPAIEIRRVQKRLKMTQCTLLQNASKLFAKGFVRKNIEYSTVTRTAPGQISGAIKFTTEDIQFSTIVPIVFDLAPLAPLNFNAVQNFEFLRSQALPAKFPAKDMLESGDLSEINQINTEFFNEPPFCELVSSRIVEYDEFLNRTPLPDGLFDEMTFNRVEEKMVIFVTLKILQKRQVVFSSEPAAGRNYEPDDHNPDDQNRGEQEKKKEIGESEAHTFLPIIIDT